MRGRSVALALLAVLGALAWSASASGSTLIARSTSKVHIHVVAHGKAVVSFRQHRARRHVLLWGALNARPHPTKGRPQVELRHKRLGKGRLAKRLLAARDRCRPYNGPRLRWVVAACRAPDGSFWAAQSWTRLHKPGTTVRAGVPELRLSHWRGPIAKLVLKLDWAHHDHFDHLYGQLTYQGEPVYGLRWTRLGVPLDRYGRNIYVDTLNSRYGRGWRRANGSLAKPFHGQFCFTAWAGNRRAVGEAYRARVAGPGATPDVAYGPVAALGAFNPIWEAEANKEQALLSVGSKFCHPN
jgi:hypothetical protein